MKIIKPSVCMYSDPCENSSLETECLYGEHVKILENQTNWSLCKLLSDNYIGWIRTNGLGHLESTTHRVITKRTFLYKNKNEKSLCIHYLPLGARLSVKKIENNWAEVYLSNKSNFNTAYVPFKHIVEVNNKVVDWVIIAEQLINTPYKWGGRDSLGIDCSALIQLSYQAYGENIPRNTSEQIKIQKPIVTEIKNLHRGCVVFWKGHVGLMVDKLNCIHANAFHMKTVIEPLDNIVMRMERNNKILKMLNFN